MRDDLGGLIRGCCQYDSFGVNGGAIGQGDKITVTIALNVGDCLSGRNAVGVTRMELIDDLVESAMK